MRVPFDWLKQFVQVRVKPAKLAGLLTMSGLEVESLEEAGTSAIFEISITPNRADCLSVRGVAREVAAITGGAFKAKGTKPSKGQGRMAGAAKVSVRSRARCLRYTARVIRGVSIGPSPQWMSARLAACGIRSINNIVDATNYVMIETGQPLHAFDLSHLRGPRIAVRMADEGQQFTTLDGVPRRLTADDLLICDAEGPVALAGVMGGENSEVCETTTDVFLESACFEQTGVRRTSKRLSLASESSRRFERGVDPNGVLDALHRLTELIVETAGGAPTVDWVDIYPRRVALAKISLSAVETNRILGSELTIVKIAAILKRVGLKVMKPRGGRVHVTVPSFRPDLTRPIDLIEEVARIYGYGEIEETMPDVALSPTAHPRGSREESLVRAALVGAGLTEAVLYGFTSEEALAPFSETGPDPIKIQNPLSGEQAVMVTTLIPNLVDVLRLNLMRQRTDVRFFALQRVFQRAKALDSIDEPRRIAGVLTGHRYPDAWDRAKEMLDFYDAKLAVETTLNALGLAEGVIFQRGPGPAFLHPGRFAYVLLGGSRAGFVGQLHPDLAGRLDLAQEVYAFELDFELLAERAHAMVPHYEEFSKFPFVTRDIAVLVDEGVPMYEVEKVISASGVDILDDVGLFDVFRGGALPAGRKSLGIALRFSRDDRTLTDEEVSAAQDNIVSELSAKLGAELR